MNRPPFPPPDSERLWELSCGCSPKLTSLASEEEEDGALAVRSLRSTSPHPRAPDFCSNLFASAELSEAGTIYSTEEISKSHAVFEKAFLERTGGDANAMRCGRRIGPLPFAIPVAKLREMARLQSALSSGLTTILKSWGNPDSRVRNTLPLPPRATAALLRCNEFANGLPDANLPVGSFRPDVLISDGGRLRVCEINARFALNGYLLTAGCVEALHSMPSSTLLGSLALGVVPSTLSLVEEIAERFDSNETMYVVVGRESPNDLAILKEAFDRHKERGVCTPEVRFVHPSQLRKGNERGFLMCMIDRDDTRETVRQCILELHQDELLALPEAVLDGLLNLSAASRCLNPVWTILLVHDKRMLEVLRTLTAEELPDEEARHFLREHIVPTMHPKSIEALDRLVQKQHGLMETTLVAKPCLLGKGEGVIFEKDFRTPMSFVEAVSEAATQMLGASEEKPKEAPLFPYVVQTFVQQKRFDIIRPPADDPSLKPVAWHVVATMLCLDDRFLGPGIFRSSERDVVALCNGGVMLLPVMELPYPSHSRFSGRTLQEIPTDEVKTALVDDGVALLCLDRAASDQREFEEFVRDSLGGQIHRHSSAVGGVWVIGPNSGLEGGEGGRKDGASAARSRTADPFPPHTDASFEPSPPRFFALSIVRADHKCGGLLGFASVEEAVGRLSDEDFDVLRNTMVRWRRPAEFSKDWMGTETVIAPVLFSRRRARVRGDTIEADHLPELDERRFWGAYHRFCTHLDGLCHESARLLPERCIVLMDNQRFVHARSRIEDPRRILLRIRFNMPESPEVLGALRAAGAKGLGPGSDRLEDWPIQTKADYMAMVDSKFARCYRARGGLYWSPSGGSTSASKGAEVCAVPSANGENRAMRDELVDLLCGIGAVPRDGSAGCCVVNLFASGGLYRSLEIFGDVFAAIDATHLPLGAASSDEDALRCIVRFGANTLCGWGSRILQLCEAAQSSQLSKALASITTIIHGGEKLSATNRSLIKKACGGVVGIFGCYGSAETGVFGVSTGSEDSEHEIYALLTDSIHVEVVDDSGTNLGAKEWGNIVVTNLKRKSVQPLIRFVMGDVGRLVNVRFGLERALEIKGRSYGASAFRLTPDTDFLFWEDVQKEALGPLTNMATEAGATCMAQIIVLASDAVTLAIFTSLPRSPVFSEAADACSIAFSNLVRRLGAAQINAETRFLKEMRELIRSPRSQKLMLWVDQRK